MKNILLPTDFSDNSWNAIQYAAELFKDDECTFHILNAYDLTIYGADFASPQTAQLGVLGTVKDISVKGVHNVAERIKEKFNNSKHKIEEISSFNSLTREIDRIHEKIGVDYLVMGTKGATGAARILFGSNTVRVLNHAKCPVIAVPNDYKYKEPQEILFPSDLDIHFSPEQLKPLLNIASRINSNVNVLHVLEGRKLREKELTNQNELENIFRGLELSFHLEKEIKVEEAIDQFDKTKEVQLLAMINNKHSFFENLFFKNKINQIGFNLSIPFLVIPS